ncbi:MAG: hypothetical protein QOH37_2346 [Nocardioidaceae bacterium]|jgi:hypothetical protein|nr:hypothetical protein [Nocardioidaceae bacterium]
MNSPRHLSVEEASRLAVTATVADLEDWARSVAIQGHVELDELVGVLGVLRSASVPGHQWAPMLTALSAS